MQLLGIMTQVHITACCSFPSCRKGETQTPEVAEEFATEFSYGRFHCNFIFLRALKGI